MSRELCQIRDNGFDDSPKCSSELVAEANADEDALSGAESSTESPVELSPSTQVQQKQAKIIKARNTASDGQKKQAHAMLKRNRKHINSFKIGDLVLLKVDDVDRGAADASNLLCIILDKKHDLFKLGSKAGVLEGHFAFNSIEKSNLVTTFTKDEVPVNEIPARTAVRLLSIGHGQGVLRCNCKKGDCRSGKCKCFKAQQKCQSRCHAKDEKQEMDEKCCKNK
jgi:hypothetical protein